MNCTCHAKNGYDHANDCPSFMRRYPVPSGANLPDPIPRPATDAEVEHLRREQIVRSNMSKWFTPDFVNWMFSQLEKLPGDTLLPPAD